MLDGLFIDTTHNSVRLIYRSVESDWRKNHLSIQFLPPTLRGVGKISILDRYYQRLKKRSQRSSQEQQIHVSA